MATTPYSGLDQEGTPDARSNQTKLGVALHAFEDRTLGGIKMLVDHTDKNSSRHKYRFERVEGVDEPKEVRGPSMKEQAEAFAAEMKAQGKSGIGETL